MALFEVTMDHPLSALDRLEWLRSSREAGSGAVEPGMRAQEDLLFLLAESYYRLGMRDAFRKAAASLDSAAPVRPLCRRDRRAAHAQCVFARGLRARAHAREREEHG